MNRAERRHPTSRFADPADVTTVLIGPCQCPGTPHAQDEAVVHRQLGYAARGLIGVAALLDSEGIAPNWSASTQKLIELGVVSWNLLGPDGKAWEPSAANIALLDEETLEALAQALDGVIRTKPLPNESGAPSVDGSPESASPTPETGQTTTSTTS